MKGEPDPWPGSVSLMRDPEGIRDLVAKAAGSLGLEEVVAAGRLFRAWEDIVGPDVAARSQPLSLREGVLRIQTDSPAWAAEVRYLAPELLRRANAALGRELARELKVCVKTSGQGAHTAGPERKGQQAVGRMPEPGAGPNSGGTPSRRPPGTPRSGLPIGDETLAEAVSRVLDAARAQRGDNKGRKGAR
jgi:predicted nucleic acid-binding Zn ribbon protein